MLTMTSALVRAGRNFGDRPAVVDDEGAATWTQHLDRVGRLAGGLASRGIEAGERFGILSRNTYQLFELLHAGYWSGRIAVPINIRLAPPEIAYILDHAACRLVAVEPVFLDQFEAPELAEWRDRVIVIGAEGIGGRPSSEALIAGHEAVDPADPAEDDDAILLYTGGTTGRSKGVRLTHKNIVSNGFQAGLKMSIQGDDVYFHVAPMFHSADLLGTAETLMGGAHAFLPAFTPEAFLSGIERYGATNTMVAPTMLVMLLQAVDPADYDLSSMRTLLYGSAPMAVEWIRKTLEALPDVKLVQGYGLTETSPLLSFLDFDAHKRALETGNLEVLKSAGQPLPAVDMIIDEAAGGEVLVRGPNVTPGYLNADDINAAAFRDGWFRTGDVGRMDENGYMYLLDRKKDMIITGGENVYCSEVEAALYQHDDVVEAAVFGLADEAYGEAVSAALVLRDGSELNAEAVIDHCRTLIGGYKVPRRIFFLDALPKSAVNKILKSTLRKMFSEAKGQ